MTVLGLAYAVLLSLARLSPTWCHYFQPELPGYQKAFEESSKDIPEKVHIVTSTIQHSSSLLTSSQIDSQLQNVLSSFVEEDLQLSNLQRISSPHQPKSTLSENQMLKISQERCKTSGSKSSMKSELTKSSMKYQIIFQDPHFQVNTHSMMQIQSSLSESQLLQQQETHPLPSVRKTKTLQLETQTERDFQELIIPSKSTETMATTFQNMNQESQNTSNNRSHLLKEQEVVTANKEEQNNSQVILETITEASLQTVAPDLPEEDSSNATVPVSSLRNNSQRTIDEQKQVKVTSSEFQSESIQKISPTPQSLHHKIEMQTGIQAMIKASDQSFSATSSKSKVKESVTQFHQVTPASEQVTGLQFSDVSKVSSTLQSSQDIKKQAVTVSETSQDVSGPSDQSNVDQPANQVSQFPPVSESGLQFTPTDAETVRPTKKSLQPALNTGNGTQNAMKASEPVQKLIPTSLSKQVSSFHFGETQTVLPTPQFLQQSIPISEPVSKLQLNNSLRASTTTESLGVEIPMEIESGTPESITVSDTSQGSFLLPTSQSKFSSEFQSDDPQTVSFGIQSSQPTLQMETKTQESIPDSGGSSSKSKAKQSSTSLSEQMLKFQSTDSKPRSPTSEPLQAVTPKQPETQSPIELQSIRLQSANSLVQTFPFPTQSQASTSQLNEIEMPNEALESLPNSVPSVLPASNQPSQGLCYLRSCDQTVTGRGLSYSRTLEIIQQEEYLTETDLSIVRRRHKKRSANGSVQTLYKRAKVFNDDPNSGRRQTSRSKRNTVGTVMGAVNGVFEILQRQFDGQLVDGQSSSDDKNITEPETSTTTAPETTTITDDEGPSTGTILAVGTAGAVGIAGIVSMLGLAAPPPPPPAPPGAPPGAPGVAQINAPLPGQAGAGITPIGTSPAVLSALSLLPAGAQAISAFPPFSQPRTFEAVAVLFREIPAPRRRKDFLNFQKFFPMLQRLSRHKRDLRLRSLAIRAMIPFRKLHYKAKLAIQRLFHLEKPKDRSNYDRFRNKFNSHYSPNFQMMNKFPADNFQTSKPKTKQNNQDLSANEDIDFENDLFGFRVKITLVNNQPCQLGVTCDEFGNKIGGFQDRFDSPHYLRQRPNCWISSWTRSIFGKPRRGSFFDLDRQTNQEFQSDGPPECRVEVNPAGCVVP